MPFPAVARQLCQPGMGLTGCISFRLYISPSGQTQADNFILNSKLNFCLFKQNHVMASLWMLANIPLWQIDLSQRVQEE